MMLINIATAMTRVMCLPDALGPERGIPAESSFLDAGRCTPLVAVWLNLQMTDLRL